jgi:hypothetical protein
MHHFRKLAVLPLAALILAAACSEQQETPVSANRRAPVRAHGTKLTAGTHTCSAAPNDTIILEDNDTISGEVHIGANCRLIITHLDKNADHKVTIFGDASVNPSALVIDQGAKIDAQGDSALPIVFTPTGSSPQPGAWGGIVIIGNAVSNDSTAVVEGLPGNLPYGGVNDADNSGIMTYVRIEYAGFQLVTDNELNGLSLYGVGSGTTLHHIEVFRGSDDGVEFFGGKVDLKYAVVIGAEDDTYDFSYGWRGNGQFWIGQQRFNTGDKGIEADNTDAGTGDLPISDPRICNITLVGRDSSYADSISTDAGNIGIQLRRNTAGRIRNAIVIGFDEAFNGTGANTSNSDSVVSSIFFAKAGYTAGNVGVANITQANPQLVAPFHPTAPDFRPAAISISSANGDCDYSGLTRVRFRGAAPRGPGLVDGVSPTWWAGWTRFGS